MGGLELKSFDAPDEVRDFEGMGRVQVVSVAGRTIGRGTFKPGWKWSESVRPIAGTDSCQTSHLGYLVQGQMRVTMDDGTEGEAGPGDVVAIPRGHDAEVIGDEDCVFLDFGEVEGYTKSG
jgi:hypothetical protein